MAGASPIISNVATYGSNYLIESSWTKNEIQTNDIRPNSNNSAENHGYVVTESPFDDSLSGFGTGEKPEYSNKYAWFFSDSNPELNRLSKNVDFLHADGSAPLGYKSVDGQLYNKNGQKINGVTINNGKSVYPDVYLSKSAFVSRPQLYMTMHHEYMHATLESMNLNFSAKEQHRIIYQWQNDQLKSWGPIDRSLFNNVINYSNPKNTLGNFPMHYSQFGFNIINYIP